MNSDIGVEHNSSWFVYPTIARHLFQKVFVYVIDCHIVFVPKLHVFSVTNALWIVRSDWRKLSPIVRIYVTTNRQKVPFPISINCLQNFSMCVPLPNCSLMFVVSFNFLAVLRKYEGVMLGFSLYALVPFGTTGSVCRKSPARNTVWLPISLVLRLRSWSNQSRASKALLWRSILNDQFALGENFVFVAPQLILQVAISSFVMSRGNLKHE